MTRSSLIEELARNFPENGMKRLLEDPQNVEELLNILGEDILRRIDFSQMRTEPAVFVQRDYSHLASDIVLTAPLRVGTGKAKRRLYLYLLIEHQSEPEALMAFRLLEYEVAIYKSQLRAWIEEHGNTSGFAFQPVIGVIFYTGTQRWERVPNFAELVQGNELLSAYLPHLQPLTINLPELSEETLYQEGGLFGAVLHVLQQREQGREQFEGVLSHCLEQLAQLPQRGRWETLLSYLYALMYYAREEPERGSLTQMIERSIQSERHRKEVRNMGKTIAEALKEEGYREGALTALQQALIRLLRKRFGSAPHKMTARIKAAKDTEQLENWFYAVSTAKTLADVGIE
jgi:predicted transposase/invertase (TIGR01784 family)